MRYFLIILFVCKALVSGANAYNVSYTLQADQLKTASGSPMPTTGLCLLVASTTNTTFTTIPNGAPTSVNSFLDGDDQILANFNLTLNNNAGTAQASPAISTNSTATPNLDSGDQLALYWFPTLTTNSTTIPAGTSYGFFRTDSTQDNGQAWVVPAAQASNYKLYFKTTDGTFFVGTHQPSEANASRLSAAVPEPGTYAMILLTGSIIGAAQMRRRRTA